MKDLTKKLLCLLVALAMVFTVCACGSDAASSSDDEDDDDKGASSSQSSDPSSEAGPAELTVPANIYNKDTLYVEFDLTEDGVTSTGNAVGLDLSDPSAMVVYLYAVETEYVFELDADYNITALYINGSNTAGFELTEDDNADILLQATLAYAGYFGPAFAEPIDDIVYVENGTATGCGGEAVVYTVMYQGEEDGELWVDKATGIVVLLDSQSDGMKLEANRISKSLNGNLPSYK